MLSIYPQSCLQDEKITIKATGLSPMQNITFSTHTKDLRSSDYFAYAHYKADEKGIVDLSVQEAVGGHYEGLFQMGLIAALRPAPHESQFLRYFKKDVENSTEIEIRLFDGFLEPKDLFQPNRKPLDKVYHYRVFMGTGVKRIIIKEGRVRGSIFLPPGKGPYPGVIDLFGTAGGLLEFRAAQFASRGIASLALAYFGYDDLPASLDEADLDLSYFREAAQILLNQSSVSKPYIGVVGVSKGGDLALSMATFIPEVSLAIAINGCNANTTTPMKINETKILPPLPDDVNEITLLPNEVLNCRGMLCNPSEYPETIIPLHETTASIMFIVGEVDCSCRSDLFAADAIRRMKNAGKTNYKLCSYKNAGHLIEPPYSAFCFHSYHKVFDCSFCWGGELKAHTEAQEESWIEMIAFIKDNIKNHTLSKL